MRRVEEIVKNVMSSFAFECNHYSRVDLLFKVPWWPNGKTSASIAVDLGSDPAFHLVLYSSGVPCLGTVTG